MRTPASLVFLILLIVPAWAGQAKPPAALADAALEPSERECRLLGGCPTDRPLTLSSLPGRFVLMEIFSMYCPYCQAEAEKVNRLYELISKSEYADKITVVGLAAGNSAFETQYFQDKFKVPFAMFPDQDMAFYSTLGDPGTPFFILAEKGKGELPVLFTHRGAFKDVDEFYQTILSKAGLKP